MVGTVLDELKTRMDNLGAKVDELSNTIVKETMCIGTILLYGGELVSEEEQKNGIAVPKQQKLLEKQGWFFCDGRAVNREDYRRLYEVIGANFGPPDAEHFNLSDLRGRFVRGVDHGAGMDPDAEKRTADKSGGKAGKKLARCRKIAANAISMACHQKHILFCYPVKVLNYSKKGVMVP